MLTILLTLIHSLLLTPDQATQINFRSIDIDRAKEVAQKENKHIFIDTYAIWCKPCKEMDRVFSQPDVAQFFNDNFINVKIDMDATLGKSVGAEYDVVWLPTLIILDAEGNVKSKIDKLVDGQELIKIASEAIRSKDVYTDRGITNNPFGGGTTKIEPVEKEFITEDNAPIVYVHDERASSGRPHIMYHEAYLHMMLMDGKQYDVAKKYLSTQEDWATDKNLKFIFDFLRQTNSKEFEYFIKNKHLFEQLVGVDKVKRSIEILIYERLFNGFPRPDFDETLRLYTWLDTNTAEQKAYDYYLKRLIAEQRNLEYQRLAKEYLTMINPFDHQQMYQYSYQMLKSKRSDVDMGECMKWAKEALIYDDQVPKYHLHIANLYFLLEQKTNAKEHCDKALALAQQKNIDSSEIYKLRNKINTL